MFRNRWFARAEHLVVRIALWRSEHYAQRSDASVGQESAEVV